jgi:FkbH-like protein
MSQEVFKQVRHFRKQGRHDKALELLRDALRRRQLEAEDVEAAGRMVRGVLADSADVGAVHILLLGQCTTTWLANALAAIAWGHGVAIVVTEGAYDNVAQELLTANGPGDAPAIVVLLPWNQRLLCGGSDREPEDRVKDECNFWRQIWGVVKDRLGGRILQVGYDWVGPGARGYCLGSKPGGDVALVRAVNDALRNDLPSGAYFAELEQISGVMGRDRFYDPRRYFWTKQPFSEAGAIHLAEHLWAGVRGLIYGPKKVLVLDLDNTIWGGIVGETGPLGIELGEGPDGEAFRGFQRYVKQLQKRGVVLTVCSKNNPADARAAFEQNPSMVLALDDFAHFDASWDPKAIGLERIAKALRLSLDGFVFVDDNPAEREHIRQTLPEVSVVEMPEDPAGFIPAVEAGLWFEAVGLTEEDAQRADQYRVERKRRGLESSFTSMDDYLDSLGMVAEMRPIDEADLDRVVQLIGKTNQFNLTTRRHSGDRVRDLLSRPGTIARTLRVGDKFGDHGVVSVMLAIAGSHANPASVPNELWIDTWLMSCRVIGRTVEEFFFNALAAEARRRGISRLIGCYIPTAKNGLVKNLYDRLGFTRHGGEDDGTVAYVLSLGGAVPAKTFVRLKDSASQ